MKTALRLAATLAMLPLLGAGCISVSSTPKQGSSGGVFVSPDKGAAWTQKSALPTAKGVQSIGGADIASFAFDAQNPKAVYAGTAGSGLLFSLDGAESWQRGGGVGTGSILRVAVHPKDTCTVYATLGNRVIKSTDCARSFEVMYTDQRAEAQVTALLIDWYKPDQIYIGTATGDFARSTDGGESWTSVRRWDSAIGDVVMSAGDSRRLWVATKTDGVSLTEDAGATWTDLRKSMDEFDGARGYAAMAEDRTAPGTLIHASRFGLLKSTDLGKTWQKMNILTPPQSVTVTALAVNPQDGKDVYYTTATKIYRSKDGGESWTAADLPTSRIASALAVDPADGDKLWLGVRQPPKQ